MPKDANSGRRFVEMKQPILAVMGALFGIAPLRAESAPAEPAPGLGRAEQVDVASIDRELKAGVAPDISAYLGGRTGKAGLRGAGRGVFRECRVSEGIVRGFPRELSYSTGCRTAFAQSETAGRLVRESAFEDCGGSEDRRHTPEAGLSYRNGESGGILLQDTHQRSQTTGNLRDHNPNLRACFRRGRAIKGEGTGPIPGHGGKKKTPTSSSPEGIANQDALNCLPVVEVFRDDLGREFRLGFVFQVLDLRGRFPKKHS